MVEEGRSPAHERFTLGRRSPLGLLLVALCTLPAGLAHGQIPAGDLAIALRPVTSGLSSPVALTHAGDGSGRLFIVDQVGIIRIVEDGVLLPTPFLDLTDRIVTLGEVFDERGLLGLAFHPQYADNGRFFVRYSAPRTGAPDEPCSDPQGFIVGCHTAVLAEFHVSVDPNTADPDSELVLFEVDEPQFNHNAGDLHFGPDGFLYFSLGDGGGAHDGLADDPPSHGPIGSGQDVETALGALLRIDVDGPAPFSIPTDNPFVGGPGLDEIYAYGFRNPYRFSFDPENGELFLADVGQDAFEEIDIVVAGSNYGWAIREGAHCFDPFAPTVPPTSCGSLTDFEDPVAEYDHGDGLAVVGGFVYRGGAFPALVGKYLFGDFSSDFGPTGRLFYLDADGDRSVILEARIGGADAPLGRFVKGFGRDEAGELYLLASSELAPFGTGGEVLRVIPPQSFVRGDADGNGLLDLTDAVASLAHLFTDGPASCPEALDANDDERLDLADPIGLLTFLFGDGAAPPAPYPDCGLDPTSLVDRSVELGCTGGVACP